LGRSESLISRAILKYGYSNFKLEILCHCKPEECVAIEQHCLDNLPHEYNILPTAGSSLGHLHSEETKAKMRKAALGVKLSEETRQKISEAAKNRINGTAAATVARSKAVLVTNIGTGEIVEYCNQKAAAEALGVTSPAIRHCLKNKKPLKNSFIITLKSRD
jgi:group I intron endonuclease